MTSVIQPSTQSSSLLSLSFEPHAPNKTVLSLLSPQQIHRSKYTRHVINCNHLCYKSSADGNLLDNMTHPHVVSHHLSCKPEATPTNIPKALLLSPPLPIRRRPGDSLTSNRYSKGPTNRSSSSDHCERNHSTLNDEYYQTKTSFQSLNSTTNKLIKSQSPPTKLKKSSHFTLLTKTNEFDSDDLLCTKNDTNYHHQHHHHHVINQLNKEEFSRLPVGFRWNYIFVKLSNWFQRIHTINYSRTSSDHVSSSIPIHHNKSDSISNSYRYQIRKYEPTRSQSQPAEKFGKIKSNLHNNDQFFGDSKTKVQLSSEINNSNRNMSSSDFQYINNSKKGNSSFSSSSLISNEKPVENLLDYYHTTQSPIVYNNNSSTTKCTNNNSCSCSIMSFNDLTYTSSKYNDIDCFCTQSCPINSHQLNELNLDNQISLKSCVSDCCCCFCQRYLNYCDHNRLVPFSSNNQYEQDDQIVQSSHYHGLKQQYYYHYYSCQHHHHHHYYHHHHHHHRRQQHHHHLSHDFNQCHIKFTTNQHTTNTHCTNYPIQNKAVRNFHLNLENQYATIGQLDQMRSDCKKISPSNNKKLDCSSPVITLQCLNLTEKQSNRLDDNIVNVTSVNNNDNSIDNEHSMNTRNISSLFIDYHQPHNQTLVQNHEHEVVEHMNEGDNVVKCINSEITFSNLDNDKSSDEKVQSMNISKTDTTIDTFAHQKFVTDLILLKRIGWYWGPLTVEEAELLLKNCSDGTFLVRDSSHDSYILSVSFRSGGQIYHTRIEHLAGKFSLALLNDLNNNVSSSVAECIERVMVDSFQDRMHFLPTLDDSSPSININTNVQFINNDQHQSDQHRQLQQFNNNNNNNNTSQPFESTRRSTSTTHIKASLIHPLSRFLIVPSLVHLCRFELLLHVRHDHIDLLPLPSNILRYLKESQYYAEFIPAYLELLTNMNSSNDKV
ncbi:unnamed protein product [Schistosoma rodhaini]|nr:unnamed protein product [Schistosoma rodhaini]